MPKKSPSNLPVDPLLAHLREAVNGWSRDKKYLVGVSGGRDSMVLLHALAQLGFRHLVVCHLDHSLRGASSLADARLVKKVSVQMGLALETARARTNDFAASQKKSLELAARELRYSFFQECATRHRCQRLILAHHADDQIETCLFNFLRGSGAAGLGGIKPVSQLDKLQIYRPLLGVTRNEIVAYQKKFRIAFREDLSNAETLHTRNKLRLEVIPVIEKTMGSSIRQAILRASQILRTEEDWMNSLVPSVGAELSCADLRAMHPALCARTVLRWLRERGVPEPGFQETQRVLAMLDTKNGPAKISLPGNMHARRQAGRLFLEGEGI